MSPQSGSYISYDVRLITIVGAFLHATYPFRQGFHQCSPYLHLNLNLRPKSANQFKKIQTMVFITIRLIYSPMTLFLQMSQIVPYNHNNHQLFLNTKIRNKFIESKYWKLLGNLRRHLYAPNRRIRERFTKIFLGDIVKKKGN